MPELLRLLQGDAKAVEWNEDLAMTDASPVGVTKPSLSVPRTQSRTRWERLVRYRAGALERTALSDGRTQRQRHIDAANERQLLRSDVNLGSCETTTIGERT